MRTVIGNYTFVCFSKKFVEVVNFEIVYNNDDDTSILTPGGATSLTHVCDHLFLGLESQVQRERERERVVPLIYDINASGNYDVKYCCSYLVVFITLNLNLILM